MKYTFNFTEINYGSIEIEAESMPNDGDVIDAIMSGGAFYKNTDYVDIRGDVEKQDPRMSIAQQLIEGAKQAAQHNAARPALPNHEDKDR